MKRWTGCIVAAIAFVAPVTPARSQGIIEMFDFYGSLRAHVAHYQEKSEVQNNLSRVGFRMQREFATGLTAFARGEWLVNLVENQIDFNIESNSSDEFGRLTREPTRVAFETRLGNVGLEKGKWGRLTVGKLWSVYSDVSLITDQFFVFSGRASGTYNAGTDGGIGGTGRAEKAVAYRNQVVGVSLGGQIQLKGDRKGGPSSWGVKLARQNDNGVYLGAAYNQAHIPPEAQSVLIGAKEYSRALIAGVKYEKGPWYLGLTYAWLDSHEATEVEIDNELKSVIFSSNGVELFTQRDFGDNVQINAGFNYQKPSEIDDSVHPDFQLAHILFGAAWYFNPRTFIYSEFMINQSVRADGSDGFNVFFIGLWYDFSTFDFESRIERGDDAVSD
jgi:predicted porin